MPSVITDTKVEIAVDARLPEEYVNEVSLRMEVYQRLGEAISLDEIEILWAEIQDRFGPAPAPAQWLYYLTRVRIYASRHGFVLLKQEKLSLTLEKKLKGKDSVIRKILMPKFKSPEEMEKKIIQEMVKTTAK